MGFCLPDCDRQVLQPPQPSRPWLRMVKGESKSYCVSAGDGILSTSLLRSSVE